MGKSIQTESRLVVTRKQGGEGGMGNDHLMDIGSFSRGEKKMS